MMLKMSAKLVAVVIFLSCGAQCYLQGINWVNEKRGEAAVDADDKGANQRVRRALKDTARAQAVNLLDDSDGGQNYPLRPYTLTNLTDVLAVEWTCNNTFGTKEKELDSERGCQCMKQMVREGGDQYFDTCCKSIWEWLLGIKKDPSKVKVIMYYVPQKQKVYTTGEKPKKSATEEFFDEYVETVRQCTDGNGFSSPRSDKLTGATVTPSKLLTALLTLASAAAVYHQSAHQ